MFVLKYNLCKAFPALTTWDLEEQKFRKVIALYRDMRTMQIREEKDAPKFDGNTNTIRRPAGDDWF